MTLDTNSLKNAGSCSLLISTYNTPGALTLCLQSVLRQTVKPREILIADDGSGEATRAVIDDFREKADLPVLHIWQQDKGFRKSRILNKTIAASTAEYIIQIDGDVILHPEFIRDHLRAAKQHYFVVGSRGLLKKAFSLDLLNAGRLPSTGKLRLHAGSILNTLRIRIAARYFRHRYKVGGRHVYYAKGCNMAFWKADIIAVNGYNEALTGWGHEDEELVVRLIHNGVQKQFLKMGGIVFHLWHPLYARSEEDYHYEVIRQAIREKRKRCDQGIGRYLPPP